MSRFWLRGEGLLERREEGSFGAPEQEKMHGQIADTIPQVVRFLRREGKRAENPECARPLAANFQSQFFNLRRHRANGGREGGLPLIGVKSSNTSDVTALLATHPAGEAPTHFRFESAGGTVGVTTSTDRITPCGGAAAWSHYLEKLGVVTDLARPFS